MSTTTIRLPEELKARIAKAAERAGTSPHSFILEAIAEKTEQAERRADFYAEADRRWADFLETGEYSLGRDAPLPDGPRAGRGSATPRASEVREVAWPASSSCRA